ARKHVVDDALVDVAGDRAALGPFEIDLGDALVLDDGDALLGDADRDEQLPLRGRQRRTARWLPPPACARAATRGGLLLVALLGPLGLRGLRGLRSFRPGLRPRLGLGGPGLRLCLGLGHRRLGRLFARTLAAAAAAASASAS